MPVGELTLLDVPDFIDAQSVPPTLLARLRVFCNGLECANVLQAHRGEGWVMVLMAAGKGAVRTVKITGTIDYALRRPETR
jgi:hypothetical protein